MGSLASVETLAISVFSYGCTLLALGMHTAVKVGVRMDMCRYTAFGTRYRWKKVVEKVSDKRQSLI